MSPDDRVMIDLTSTDDEEDEVKTGFHEQQSMLPDRSHNRTRLGRDPSSLSANTSRSDKQPLYDRFTGFHGMTRRWKTVDIGYVRHSSAKELQKPHLPEFVKEIVTEADNRRHKRYVFGPHRTATYILNATCPEKCLGKQVLVICHEVEQLGKGTARCVEQDGQLARTLFVSSS